MKAVHNWYPRIDGSERLVYILTTDLVRTAYRIPLYIHWTIEEAIHSRFPIYYYWEPFSKSVYYFTELTDK